MKDLDHNGLRYEGRPGEPVTIRVTAHNTAHLITCNFDGEGATPLAEGDDITFNFKTESGDVTHLQVFLDFTGNGKYEFVTENVEDCPLPASPPGGCLHRCLGPDEGNLNFKFFVE